MTRDANVEMAEDQVPTSSFVTARDELGGALIEPQSVLRLILPIVLHEQDWELGKSLPTPWRVDAPSDSLFYYARDICESWSAHPAQLLGPLRRGRDLTIQITRPGTGPIVALLREVRVLAFPTAHLAFLVLGFSPPAPMPLVDWLDVASGTRFAGGKRALAMSLLTYEGDVARGGWIDATSERHIGGLLQAIHHHILARRWDDRDHSSSLPGRQLIVSGSWFTRGVPPSRRDLVLYLVRNQFHSHQEVGVSEESRTRRVGGHLPYGLQQDFVSTLESSNFVAFDTTAHDFFQNALPDHLEKEYLFAWLFALQQRYFLIAQVAALADQALSESSKRATDRFAEVEARASALAEFEARGYEIHLLQREHHHRYWMSIRAALDLDNLHAYLVGLLARAMDRARAQRAEEEDDARRAAAEAEAVWAEQEKEERTRVEQRERDLEFRIILALAIPGVVFGFAGINIRGWTAGVDGSRWWIALILLVSNLALIIGLLWFGQRRRKLR